VSSQESRTHITENREKGIVVLAVAGRLDARTAAALEQRLIGMIDAGEKRFVIDCAKLDYVSSAGLRVLLIAVKRLASVSGIIALAALQEQIEYIIDIVGFDTIFQIHSTTDEALTALAVTTK